MGRLIDADELKNAIYESYNPYQEYWAGTISRMHELIDSQPTVDAAPVVHGGWEACEDDWNYETTYECLICGYEFKMEQGVELDWRYCPKCGSKMDGGGK